MAAYSFSDQFGKSDTYLLSRLRRARDYIAVTLPYLDGDLYEELSRALVIINKVYDRILDSSL